MARLTKYGDLSGFAFTNATGSDIANGTAVTVNGLHGTYMQGPDLADGKAGHAEFLQSAPAKAYKLVLNNPLAADLALGADVVAAAGIAYTATTDDDGIIATLDSGGLSVLAIGKDSSPTTSGSVDAAVIGDTEIYVVVVDNT